MKKLVMAAVVAAIGLGGAVQAATLIVVDGNGNQVPAVGPWPVAPVHLPFDSGPQGQMTVGSDEAPPAFPDNIPTGTMGYGGMFLKLVDPGSASVPVTFKLRGHGDAIFNNNFVVTGCPINWFTATTPVNTTVTCSLPANQLIPFTFTPSTNLATAVNNGIVTPPNTLSPGGNGRPTLNPLFWSQPDFGLFEVSQTTLNQGTAFWVGLSDGGGGGPVDFDMQDMVVLISVPPSPAAAIPTLSPIGAMILAALLAVVTAFGLRSRRRMG